MCRLFGLSAGRERVHATFWLLEAPNSLAVQSRRNPDGYGLGTYGPEGTPDVDKRPAAAHEDELFALEAKRKTSPQFIAHVRYATTGRVSPKNTHPFESDRRMFAHNGFVGDLQTLEARLDGYIEMVRGETDSERLLALISKEIDSSGGDVATGIGAAAAWVASELPLFSINFVFTTTTELWALRYPESHDLLVLERAAGGPRGDRHFDAGVAGGTIRIRSPGLIDNPAIVVASERMDEDPGWYPLGSGELLHVDADLRVTRDVILDRPPRYQLRRSDLDPLVASSQSATRTSSLSGIRE